MKAQARVTYLGEQIWPRRKANQYAKESWFSLKIRQAKAWTKWLAIRFAIGVSALVLLFAGYSVRAFDSGRTLTVQNVIAAAAPMNIGKAKTDMINQLALLENQNGVPGYFDDNSRGTLPKKDKISYGAMAFKISTIQRFSKECDNAVLSDQEAVIVALDEVKAKTLAECAIFDHGHLAEWSAATQEMFIKVKVINGLTK